MTDERKKFQIPAILDGLSLRKDGSVSLKFATNEVSDANFIILKQFYGTFGHLLFAANAFQDEDIPQGNAEDGAKTPSQRLRDVLFVLYKQRGGKIDFEDFYRKQMDVIIEKMKGALTPK